MEAVIVVIGVARRRRSTRHARAAGAKVMRPLHPSFETQTMRGWKEEIAKDMRRVFFSLSLSRPSPNRQAALVIE